MSIRLRCDQCRKQMSVDDAFAGGMCRCPYCKATVLVPGSRESGRSGARPADPGRPESPGEAPRTQQLEPAHIPMANPVRFQGMLAIALLGGVVIMVAAVAWLLFFFEPPAQAPNGAVGTAPVATQTVSRANPFAKASAPTVLGDVAAFSPIAYCIDGGTSMRDGADFAMAMTRASLRSLGKGDSFTVFLAGDKSPQSLGPLHGGDEGVDAAMQWAPTVTRTGATNLAQALTKTLELSPRTLVLFYGQKDVSNLAAVAAAGKGKTQFVLVCIEGDNDAIESGRKLAAELGGEFRSYGVSELSAMLDAVGEP